jgi:hypothetical protein
VDQPADLLTPAGDELLDRLNGETVNPERALQLAAELRNRFPADLVAAALTQQTLRLAAREKFSRAGEMYFTRAGLEQASAEVVARHSAGRFAGLALVADMCCGIGGDLIALAGGSEKVLAVDADLQTLRFARRNLAVHGLTGTFVCGDVRDLPLRLLRGLSAAFIDPARRAGGHRLRADQTQPPLDWCLSLAGQVPRIGIKAAPGLPRELIPAGWEAEFVAVGRALKESLLWSPALASTQRRATILPGGHTLVARPDSPPSRVADPGDYLIDPSPSVTRAGLVRDLARDLGAWQIDPMIAFLSTNELTSTPFGRTLRIVESRPWHEKQVARRLRELGVGSADIRRRGLAGDVKQIHGRLGLQGDRAATIVLTRRDGKPWALICEDIPSPAQATDPGASC